MPRPSENPNATDPMEIRRAEIAINRACEIIRRGLEIAETNDAYEVQFKSNVGASRLREIAETLCSSYKTESSAEFDAAFGSLEGLSTEEVKYRAIKTDAMIRKNPNKFKFQSLSIDDLSFVKRQLLDCAARIEKATAANLKRRKSKNQHGDLTGRNMAFAAAMVDAVKRGYCESRNDSKILGADERDGWETITPYESACSIVHKAALRLGFEISESTIQADILPKLHTADSEQGMWQLYIATLLGDVRGRSHHAEALDRA